MKHRTDTEAVRRSFDIMRTELRRRIPMVLIVTALMIIGTAVALISPLLFKIAIDTAIPAKDVGLVLWLLAGMVATPILSTGLSALQDYLNAYIGEVVSQALRKQLFEHLLCASIGESEKAKTGEMVTRMTRECGRIGDVYVVQVLLPIFSNVAVAIGIFVVMSTLNWRLSLFALLALPASYILTRVLARRAKVLEKEYSDIYEDAHNYLQELFYGLRTVRGFGGESIANARWQDWIAEHWRINSKVVVLHNLLLRLPTDFINNVTVGCIFGYGAVEIIRENMSVGGLVAFLVYIPRLHSTLQALLRAHVGTQQAKVSAEKIDALFHLEQESFGEIALLPADAAGIAVDFCQVSFCYERDSFGVVDLSFSVKPGEFLGIVGPSGGGKSSVIDLLMGYYSPDSGTIRIDGHDMRELSIESLRSQIGFVPQDIFLWNATIGENIAYPRVDVESDAIEKAARIAQIHEFIAALPEGYDTVVGERGVALSNGERQRLAIARAILRQPRILVLDEATSSLDALTEVKVREAIEEARTGRTTIVVAHRLATVMHADTILVLQEGRVIETGHPKELLARRGLFFDLYQAQLLELPDS